MQSWLSTYVIFRTFNPSFSYSICSCINQKNKRSNRSDHIFFSTCFFSHLQYKLPHIHLTYNTFQNALQKSIENHLLQDALVEELLQFFVTIVDGELFKRVHLEIFCYRNKQSHLFNETITQETSINWGIIWKYQKPVKISYKTWWWSPSALLRIYFTSSWFIGKNKTWKTIWHSWQYLTYQNLQYLTLPCSSSRKRTVGLGLPLWRYSQTVLSRRLWPKHLEHSLLQTLLMVLYKSTIQSYRHVINPRDAMIRGCTVQILSTTKLLEVNYFEEEKDSVRKTILWFLYKQLSIFQIFDSKLRLLT